jgi:hypothetical protein
MRSRRISFSCSNLTDLSNSSFNRFFISMTYWSFSFDSLILAYIYNLNISLLPATSADYQPWIPNAHSGESRNSFSATLFNDLNSNHQSSSSTSLRLCPDHSKASFPSTRNRSNSASTHQLLAPARQSGPYLMISLFAPHILIFRSLNAYLSYNVH